MVDDKPVSDATMASAQPSQLVPISMKGTIQNMAAGRHVIKLMAAVDRNTLNIPHYNPNNYEHTIQPSIFATLVVTAWY